MIERNGYSTSDIDLTTYKVDILNSADTIVGVFDLKTSIFCPISGTQFDMDDLHTIIELMYELELDFLLNKQMYEQ